MSDGLYKQPLARIGRGDITRARFFTGKILSQGIRGLFRALLQCNSTSIVYWPNRSGDIGVNARSRLVLWYGFLLLISALRARPSALGAPTLTPTPLAPPASPVTPTAPIQSPPNGSNAQAPPLY